MFIYIYIYRFSVISLLKRVISYLYICIIIVLTQRSERSERSGVYYVVYSVFPMNEER